MMARTFLRMLGAAILVLLLIAGGILFKASRGLNKVRDIPLRSITVATDSATIERGRHLVTAVFKCRDCHGADLGGLDPFAEAGPLGVVNSSNITGGQGGVMGRYADAAVLARTIRHAVKADGTPILIMPSNGFIVASDADIGAVIAYIRSVPPVDRTIKPSEVRPLGKILYATGMFPIVEADQTDHATPPAPDTSPVATVEYGGYLSQIGGCLACHGQGLSGGKVPGTPPDWKPATNISPEGLKGWTEADFVKALREGIRPNGTPIDTLMPWKAAGQMDSTELRAVWMYLQSRPPRAYGNH